MDSETATSHVLMLQIDDAGYIPVKTVQKSLTITVTDVNDNAPVIKLFKDNLLHLKNKFWFIS